MMNRIRDGMCTGTFDTFCEKIFLLCVLKKTFFSKKNKHFISKSSFDRQITCATNHTLSFMKKYKNKNCLMKRKKMRNKERPENFHSSEKVKLFLFAS